MLARNDEYLVSCIRGYQEVLNGDKPMLIVSRGKDEDAYFTIHSAGDADTGNLYWHFGTGTCADGEQHQFLIVSNTSPTIVKVRDLLARSKAGEISRKDGQIELGRLLGYSEESIEEFTASDVAKRCPCDFCGGKPE
jgi:hypothetical protein